MESIPKLRVEEDEICHFKPILGEIPSLLAPPPGRHFNPRCPIAEAACHLAC